MKSHAFVVAVFLCWRVCMQVSAQDDPAEQARRAAEALQSGKYAEAIAAYEQLVEGLPLSGLKMNLGLAYYMSGQFLRAIEVLETVTPEAESDPELISALLYLGNSYFQVGQPGKAIGPLRKYLVLEGDDKAAREMLTDALEAEGRHGEAARQLRRLIEQSPQDPRLFYRLGRSYESLSGESFERLEELAPESAYWLALIGDLRLTQQQYSAAFYFYRKALVKDPKIRGVHVAISQIYRVKDHPDWAEAELQKEMELGMPNCESEPMVCAFLGQDYLKLAGLASQEETPETLYWRVQAYNQLAMAAFNTLAKMPASAALHRLKAEINRSRGDHKESADEWRKALDLLPGDREVRQEWAFSLVLSRDFETARPVVEEMLRDDPESALLNFMAGEIRLNQQEAEDAVPFFLKSLQKDPEFLSNHASLGRAYLDLSEPAKALPYLEKALVLDTDGSIHYQLARAYQGAGQTELARETMRKYQEIRRADQAETEQLLEEMEITPP